ncbi:MAG: extracellular solute-binding protein [Candidatus Limnocylindria bacterium]
MSGRRTGAGVLVLGMILVLAACGRSDEEGGGGGGAAVSQAPEVDTAAASGEIDVWAMGAEGESLDVLAESFSEEYPDISVNVTPVPWDAAHDRIVNAIAGGEVPDVTMVGTTWMGEFAALGGLDPTPANIDGSQFFEGAWNTTIVEGTSYAVPWYVETRLLYYRTDLAEEGGVGEAPGTWDDLKAAAAAMQEAGAEYGISLQPGGTGSWQTWMPFFWQAGGEIQAEDGTFTLDGEPCVAALTYYDSFFEEGLTPPAAADVPVEAQFANGEVASFISGPWMVNVVEEAGTDPEAYTVAHQPTEEAGTSFVGGANMAVLADADNKEAGWAFLEYLSRPEVQATWYETVSALPAVTAAWDEEALSGDERLTAFGDQLEDAKAPPSIPTWEQIAAEIDLVIERVTVGDMTPEDGCAAMQEEASAIGTGQ